MKLKPNNQFLLRLYCISLIFVVISCNQSQSHQLRLKYTSGIHSVLEDSKGNIWFGSYNEGLGLLHDGKLQYFTTENGLSHNQVRNIYEDKNGIIWFECGKGLSTYNGKKLTLYTERDYNSKNEWKLNDGDLWFKGNEIEAYNKLEGNPGVYQYDGKKLSYRALPVHTKPGHENHYSISTNFVQSKNGTVWFGSYGAVIGYNGSDFKVINDSLLGLNDKTGHFHARSIMEDSKGNLWIANNGIGVLKYDGKKIINFTEQQKLKQKDTNGNSLDKVFSIGEDQLGNIWFGTAGSGIWRYDGKSVKNFSIEDGVTSKHIWTIYKSKKGELWFEGANPSGVYRFNGTSFERKY